MLDQLIQYGCIDLPRIQEFCCLRREPKLLNIIILPIWDIRFTKKEVRRHIKVFGDPDDETIAQVRCPPLEIPAEGGV